MFEANKTERKLISQKTANDLDISFDSDTDLATGEDSENKQNKTPLLGRLFASLDLELTLFITAALGINRITREFSALNDDQKVFVTLLKSAVHQEFVSFISSAIKDAEKPYTFSSVSAELLAGLRRMNTI